jgi:hypothetical protein
MEAFRKDSSACRLPINANRTCSIRKIPLSRKESEVKARGAFFGSSAACRKLLAFLSIAEMHCMARRRFGWQMSDWAMSSRLREAGSFDRKWGCQNSCSFVESDCFPIKKKLSAHVDAPRRVPSKP